MYMYFELDTVTVLNELVVLVKSIDKPAPEEVKAPQI